MPTTTTTVIGVIDLTSFCGCPDSCTDCCNVTTDCCSSVKRTLYATWASDEIAGCPGFNGLVTTLHYDSGSTWIGTSTVCGSTFTVTLVCDGTPQWVLSVSGGGACSANVTLGGGQISATCTPLNITFPTVDITGAGACACCIDPTLGGPATIIVTD